MSAETLTFQGRRYLLTDVSDDAKLVAQNLQEAQALAAQREMEHKHFSISVQALAGNLSNMLEGLSYEEVEAPAEEA
ncbi:MAG: hypothetical protein EB168_10350 [Euryarchaeota archaeon]|nr:hypothetical protein [Euryarchaeota archaeon]